MSRQVTDAMSERLDLMTLAGQPGAVMAVRGHGLGTRLVGALLVERNDE